MHCEQHGGLGGDITKLRLDAIRARLTGNEEEAQLLERRADLLEDAVVIYHLWTPWRSRVPREEALEIVQEIEAEGREIMKKISQTTCPICLRHLTGKVDHLNHKLKVLIEEHINES
jgi:(2Fe-2S) ferredoxin